MQIVRRRDTAAEVAVRSELHRLGLRFRVDASAIPGRRRADIVFRRARVAVFVDGCFWHGCPEHASWPKANAAWWRTKINGNIVRDRETDLGLQAAGWRVERVWEHVDPILAARVIALAIRGRIAGGARRSRPAR